MSLLSTIKFQKTSIGILAAILSFVLLATGCEARSDDYAGTWMGVDESRGNPIVFEYEIDPSDTGNGYTIKVTQSQYQNNVNNSATAWVSTAPHFFTGKLDGNGNLVSDIGVIKADPGNFQLKYGNISLVRKAKNTEVKLKYVARNYIESKYPGIAIGD